MSTSPTPSVIDTQPVKGTRDFYPDDLRVRSWLFDKWRQTAAKFAFEEYDACVLEHEELYVRKAGDEITGQLYNFEDKGGRKLALRPELTPSLARMIMAKGAALALPVRWFAIPQCFRYENVQRGRKREHFQWNMDIIGLPGVAAEAELLAAMADFLHAVGFNHDATKPEVILRVSNRQVLGHVLEQSGIGAGSGEKAEQFAAVCVVIDKRDKIGDAATMAELTALGVPTAAAATILTLLDTRGPGREGLARVAAHVPADNPGLLALSELVTLAEAFGIAHLLVIDLSVIRGLSYYTGTVWEAFDATGALPRAIAGGGRYDRLLEVFGGKPTPMVGFGFGDVVICEILKERGLLPTLGRKVDDVIFPMSAPEFAVANRIAVRLRAQGRTVAVDYSQRRFKHVIQRAEDDGAQRLFIIGGNEVQEGVAVVRTLGATKQETKVPLSEWT